MTSPGPVAFTIAGIDIMWYGILIGTGFILAILLCYKRAPQHGIQSDSIIDFALWMIPVSIVGARLYYVIFRWDLYRENWAEILHIRNGGLAILLVLFLLWVDRRRKFPGQIALLYGMLYSVERFCVEHLRTDSLMIGPFRQAQVLSAVVFIACLILYLVLNYKEIQQRSIQE